MFGAVLTQPGVRPVYVASILGRLPMGAIGLLFVLLTHEATGSYAAGGVVAAAEAIAAGLVAPALGRAVDRHGQGAVLIPTGIACALATGTFAALPEGTPVVLIVVVAAAAGAMLPPLSACQRALWNGAIEPRLRHSAYTLDAVVFELVFIAGPLVLVGGIGAWSLRAAVAACAVATLLGTIAFTLTSLSRAWRPDAEAAPLDLLGPLRDPGVRTVLIAVGLFAVGISPTEVGVAAFARDHGAGAAIGVLLALWGLGSMLGGIVAGQLPAPADPARRLSAQLVVLALLSVPLAIVDTPVGMGVALLVAGAMLAPSLALAFALLSDVSPAGSVTESQTWATTAIGGGVALGAATGGWLIDEAGTSAALVLPAVVALLAAGVVGGRLPTLRRPVVV